MKKPKIDKPFLCTHLLSLFNGLGFLEAVFFAQLYILKMLPERSNVYQPYFFLKHEEKPKVSRIHAFSRVITRSLSWGGEAFSGP